MKTGTVLFVAVVVPFGSLLLAGMLLRHMLVVYRRRRYATALR